MSDTDPLPPALRRALVRVIDVLATSFPDTGDDEAQHGLDAALSDAERVLLARVGAP